MKKVVRGFVIFWLIGLIGIISTGCGIVNEESGTQSEHVDDTDIDGVLQKYAGNVTFEEGWYMIPGKDKDEFYIYLIGNSELEGSYYLYEASSRGTVGSVQDTNDCEMYYYYEYEKKVDDFGMTRSMIKLTLENIDSLSVHVVLEDKELPMNKMKIAEFEEADEEIDDEALPDEEIISELIESFLYKFYTIEDSMIYERDMDAVVKGIESGEPEFLGYEELFTEDGLMYFWSNRLHLNYRQVAFVNDFTLVLNELEYEKTYDKKGDGSILTPYDTKAYDYKVELLVEYGDRSEILVEEGYLNLKYIDGEWGIYGFKVKAFDDLWKQGANTVIEPNIRLTGTQYGRSMDELKTMSNDEVYHYLIAGIDNHSYEWDFASGSELNDEQLWHYFFATLNMVFEKDNYGEIFRAHKDRWMTGDDSFYYVPEKDVIAVLDMLLIDYNLDITEWDNYDEVSGGLKFQMASSEINCFYNIEEVIWYEDYFTMRISQFNDPKYLDLRFTKEYTIKPNDHLFYLLAVEESESIVDYDYSFYNLPVAYSKDIFTDSEGLEGIEPLLLEKGLYLKEAVINESNAGKSLNLTYNLSLGEVNPKYTFDYEAEIRDSIVVLARYDEIDSVTFKYDMGGFYSVENTYNRDKIIDETNIESLAGYNESLEDFVHLEDVLKNVEYEPELVDSVDYWYVMETENSDELEQKIQYMMTEEMSHTRCEEALKDSVGDVMTTTFPFLNYGYQTYQKDGRYFVSQIVGYIKDNQFFFATMEGEVIDSRIDWSYIESELIAEDIERLIGIGEEALQEEYEKRYGDDLYQFVISNSGYVSGMEDGGHTIWCEFEMEVSEEHWNDAVGSIGPIEGKSGWLGGYTYVSINETEDGYEVGGIGLGY